MMPRNRMATMIMIRYRMTTGQKRMPLPGKTTSPALIFFTVVKTHRSQRGPQKPEDIEDNRGDDSAGRKSCTQECLAIVELAEPASEEREEACNARAPNGPPRDHRLDRGHRVSRCLRLRRLWRVDGLLVYRGGTCWTGTGWKGAPRLSQTCATSLLGFPHCWQNMRLAPRSK